MSIKQNVGNAALGVPFDDIFVRLWNGEGAVPYKKHLFHDIIF